MPDELIVRVEVGDVIEDDQRKEERHRSHQEHLARANRDHALTSQTG
jgi:hypothetical protein